MMAVVESGSHQYLVKVGDIIEVEKLEGEPGAELDLKVLSCFDAGQGSKSALLKGEGVYVKATVLKHMRGEKLIIFKKRRRKNSRSKAGHRQSLTVLKVSGVMCSGV